MSNKLMYINIENHIYHFFGDVINIKKFYPSKTKIDKKSYKNIRIYYIAYVTIKTSKQLKINNANPLYLIINKMNRYFEEINTNKYLTLVPSNESKTITKNKKNCVIKFTQLNN